MPKKAPSNFERDITIEDRIVLATVQCFDELGIVKTSIKDIATRADLARQTIYRYFPTRHHLAVEVLVREIRDHSGLIASLLRRYEYPPTALSEALVQSIERARKHPYTRIVVSDEGAALMAKVPGANRVLIDTMGEQWLPTLNRWQDAGYLRGGVSMDQLLTWITMVMFISISREDLLGLHSQNLRNMVTSLISPGFFDTANLSKDFPTESASR